MFLLLSTHLPSSLTKTLKNLEIWQNYVKVSDTRRDEQRMEMLETFEWIIEKQLVFAVKWSGGVGVLVVTRSHTGISVGFFQFIF